MILFIVFNAICLFLGYVCFCILHHKKVAIPPGLKSLPIVKGNPVFGIFLKLKSELSDYLMNLKETYGNIFIVKFGMREMVVLNDFQVIKRTMKDEGDNFSGMWEVKFRDVLSSNTGILFIDGDRWFKQRTFLLKVLRDFGFGKSRSYEIVQGECKLLIEELHNLNGHHTDFSAMIPIYTANIISKFIMSKRFLRNDPKIKRIEEAVFMSTKQRNWVRLFHLLFPMFDRSEITAKFLLWITSMKRNVEDAIEIFEKEQKERLKSLDLMSEGEDLMDRFLIEQRRLIDKNGTPESFTDKQLSFLSFELFAAGYETTSTTLGWSLMYMSKYPDIQKKVHEEIIFNIGSDRLPTMNDKKSLIFTQAVMDEVLRLSSVVPQGLHRTFNDTTVDGFFVPKNSLIYINLHACLRDSKIWLKPLEFWPDHFLERSVEGVQKYAPREELIPFSIGKRKCIGEPLAKMEYFIFFVAILQRFQVRFLEDISEEQYQNDLRGNRGIIRFSKIKNYIFEKY